MSTRLAAPALALLVTLSAGCASSEPSAPPPPPDELFPVSRDFERAVGDFEQKLEAQAAVHGWPARVPLAGTPPRPTVKVRQIKNRTREMVDVDALRDELVRRLGAQGVVSVAADADEAGATDAAYDMDATPPVLLVTGTIEDDVKVAGGVRHETRTVVLRLIDVRDGGIVTQSQTVSKRMYDVP